MSEYDIYMGKEQIGQAWVHKEGLYYSFRCRCEVKSDIICKVVVSCDGHHESLGILVPEGKWYTLTKRIPIKRLGNGKPEFQVIPRCQKRQGTFICVYPDEPFRYIRQLQNAYLQRRGGENGIVIQDNSDAQSNWSSTGQ